MSFATQALSYDQFEKDTVLPRPIVTSGQWDASKYVSSAVGGAGKNKRKTAKKTSASKSSKRCWGQGGRRKTASKSKKTWGRGGKKRTSSKDKK